MNSLLFLAAFGAATTGSVAQTLPSFPEEKIGLPPLSLAESIARPDAETTFRFKPPRFAASPSPFPERLATRARRGPQPSMRVIRPNPAIDYKLRWVVPDSSIDPKMIVKPPGGETPLSK